MKDYVSLSNMMGTLGSGTPIVSSESRVEVEDNGDVESELNIISDDSVKCRSHHQAHRRGPTVIIRWGS